jgi:hypothetical protein
MQTPLKLRPGRRLFLASLVAVSATALLPNISAANPSARYPTMQVFKSPYCGCCAAWVEHISNAGFHAKTVNIGDVALNNLKAKYGISANYASCHTAIIAGYVVEGHVPADDIKTLLDRRPEITGLAVPGMPMGSPGMEYGPHSETFATLQIAKDGTASVFNMHNQ